MLKLRDLKNSTYHVCRTYSLPGTVLNVLLALSTNIFNSLLSVLQILQMMEVKLWRLNDFSLAKQQVVQRVTFFFF